MKLLKIKKYKIQSNSEKRKFYEVIYSQSLENWQCSCIANSFGNECSHIRQIKNEIWLENLTKN